MEDVGWVCGSLSIISVVLRGVKLFTGKSVSFSNLFLWSRSVLCQEDLLNIFYKMDDKSLICKVNIFSLLYALKIRCLNNLIFLYG